MRTHDAEVATTLQQSGGVGRLRQLATCDIAAIASAANGCLRNLANFWAATEGEWGVWPGVSSEAARSAPRHWHRAATRLQFAYVRHAARLRGGSPLKLR